MGEALHSKQHDARLESTREFWNRSPCGGQPTLSVRAAHRYRLEPWLPDFLHGLARAGGGSFLEVGCGQGTDAITVCRDLPGTARYLGIDYSDLSVAAARQALDEADLSGARPEFRAGNAEALDVSSNSVDVVYSMGVLHHTADEHTAIAEVFRVLRPGGSAHIFLYRKGSPKVSVAKALRALQHGLDRLFGGSRTVYRWLYGRHGETQLGTMLLECFGVPYMKWYSRAEMRALFAAGDIVRLDPVGYNLPWMVRSPTLRNPFGYFWYVHARKPMTAATADTPRA